MTRRKDATATRQALLDAARELFTGKGFDRTTVRDIAARAGVNQALLFRYFGSKEELLGRVLAEPGAALLADVPRERLLGELLRRVLSSEPGADRESGKDSMLMLAMTGPGPAAETLRREVAEPYTEALAALTDEPDARVRAELTLAWVLGLSLTMNMPGGSALADADPATVRALVLQAMSTLLEHSDTR
jgi:AcrR family transcriptional regulator